MLPNPPPALPPTPPIPPKLNVGASVDAAAPVPPVAVVKAPAPVDPPDAPPKENPNVLLGAAAADEEEEDAAPPEAAVDVEEESPHRLAALPVFARMLVVGRREVKDAVVEGGRTELENDVNCDKDDDDEGREEPKTSGG